MIDRTLEIAALICVSTILILLLLTHDDELHCQEDEVAIHGGIERWYDPDAPLECVTFDEFPEAMCMNN